jgi:hypothetical protein
MKCVRYSGKSPEYLDSFPKDCERSCKGAIHLLPNTLRDISDDEYNYIKKKYPKMKLTVVPTQKPAVKKVKMPEAAKASGESKSSKKKAKKKK